MPKWKKFRAWINRDDGKIYRAGNKNLKWIEIVGYLFLIISVVVYLLHNKTGFNKTWIGWLSLALSVILLTWANLREARHNKDTKQSTSGH
jgi:hypothetical protein